MPNLTNFTPMFLSYSISGRLLLNLYIISLRGNHLSVLYDKIPAFYAIKYPKFTTITFYPSAWWPKPLITLPNGTISLLDRARILTIFSLTWQYQAQAIFFVFSIVCFFSSRSEWRNPKNRWKELILIEKIFIFSERLEEF